MNKTPWDDLDNIIKHELFYKAAVVDDCKNRSLRIDRIARAIYEGIDEELPKIRHGIMASDGNRDREIWKVIYRNDGTYTVFFKDTKSNEPGMLDSTDERLTIYTDKQTYIIHELEWMQRDHGVFTANTLFGDYRAVQSALSYNYYYEFMKNYMVEKTEYSESLEQAKQLAQNHYEDQMKSILKPV